MGDFGHFAVNGPNLHIDGWGAGPFRLGKWLFEDSDRFGPALVNRNGELKANPYPGEKHPFWVAYAQWRKGGRRMAEDGATCLWNPPKPTLFRRVNGRREIVEFGEEGGGYREVSSSQRPDRKGE